MSPEFHTTPGLVLTLMLGIELPYSPAPPELHKPIGVVVLELMLLWSRLEAVVPNRLGLGSGLVLTLMLGTELPYSPAPPELHKPIGVVVLELMLLW